MDRRPAHRDRILVIEDHQDIAQLITLHLTDLGLAVDQAGDGRRGLSRAQSGCYALIILDLMLPGLDGLEICRRLRRQDIQTPVLMLTARSSELDRVLGLEIGADDYLAKPFSIRELMARVKAILRRMNHLSAAPEPPGEHIRVGELSIDCARRDVSRNGEAVHLTAREFDLLCHFARHPGRVFSRGQLLDQVWGYGHEGYEHTVNSHINRLRAKLEEQPAEPRFILTVWGVGYKFATPAAALA